LLASTEEALRMKRQVKQAIKAAGLDVADFWIRADEFESALSNVKAGNAQSKKVVKALGEMGIKCRGYKTGYDAWIWQPGKTWANSFDYCNPASRHHY